MLVSGRSRTKGPGLRIQATEYAENSRKKATAMYGRIITLERLFNIREGQIRKDGNLPDRFLKKPLPEGASKGQVLDLDRLPLPPGTV